MRFFLTSIPLALLCVLSGCGTLPEEDLPPLRVELRSINISATSVALGNFCVPIDIVLSNRSSKILTVDLRLLGGVIQAASLENSENGDRWEFPRVTNGMEDPSPHPMATLEPNAKKNCVVYVYASGAPLRLVNYRLLDISKSISVPQKLSYVVNGVSFSHVRFPEPGFVAGGHEFGQGELGNRPLPGPKLICVIGSGKVPVQ